MVWMARATQAAAQRLLGGWGCQSCWWWTSAANRIARWQALLDRFGLVLDCVTEGASYKLSRIGSGEYVGRILPDALKFRALRVLALGLAAFEEICRSCLALSQTAWEG